MDAPGAPGTPIRPTLGPASGWALDPGEDRTPVRLRDFIEVRGGTPRAAGPGGAAAVPPDPELAGPPPVDLPGTSVLAAATEPRWSLWGDAEA